ncbi:MAG: HAD family hydrolase, partial [Pseudomonadota bacterium]
MDIRAIIFDKDGTLLDFVATYTPATFAIINALAQGDTTLAERLGDSIGFDYPARRIKPGSIVIAGTNAQIADRLQRQLPSSDKQQFRKRISDLYQRYTQDHVTQIAGLAQCLHILQVHKIRLGIATNDDERLACGHLCAMGVA